MLLKCCVCSAYFSSPVEMFFCIEAISLSWDYFRQVPTSFKQCSLVRARDRAVVLRDWDGYHRPVEKLWQPSAGFMTYVICRSVLVKMLVSMLVWD